MVKSQTKRYRIQTVTAGQERSGKSYYAEKIARAYANNGGTALAYNVGKDTDFDGFIMIEPILPKEHIRIFLAGDKEQINDFKQYPAIEYFRIVDTKKVYHFKDFTTLFEGKCVKMYKVHDLTEQRLFWVTVKRFIANTYLILDDTKSVFRHGVSREFSELACRKNHAGEDIPEGNKYRKTGIDINFIFHSLDKVPDELYDYNRYIVMFRTVQLPKTPVSNDQVNALVERGFKYLQEQPLRSYVTIDTHEMTITAKPYK